MYKLQFATRSGWLSMVAAALTCFIGMPLASAASFTYSLTDLSGTITTNCNNCVLNSSNITAWSMSVPGFISIASTTPGAQLSIPAGDTDMVATPEAITFNFNAPYGGIIFSAPSANVGYQDDQGGNIGFGPGNGIVAACKNDFAGDCMFVGGGDDAEPIALPVVPFASVVTYNFTGKVTGATGTYSSAGTTVSGTFTIDFGAGDGALPVSFTAPWSSSSAGSNPRVVGSTLKSGGVTFSDAGSTGSMTSVAGLATAESSAPNEYFAHDTEFSDPTNSVEHSFQLIGGTGPNAPFDANGLPLFQNATGGAGGTLYAYVGNATAGQLDYTITAFAPAPTTVSLSPLSLSFPSTAVGSISAPLAVTLKNTSTQQVSIASITLTGGQTDDFALTSNCGAVLAVNASCTISVTFAPLFAGAKQATFTVIDNAHGSQRSVNLTGTAAAASAPALKLSALSLSFASQQVGTASATRAVTVSNTGTAVLSISSIAVVGLQADDFTLANACVSSLAPGKSCTIFITFKPVAAGAKSAAVLIADNAHGSQRSVALTGTGR
jgi:hypothetical protein